MITMVNFMYILPQFKKWKNPLKKLGYKVIHQQLSEDYKESANNLFLH